MRDQDTNSPFISNAQKNAGSAMIIALIFSCIITFGIAAILPLGLTDWKMSSRNSGQEAAFTLAESGTEEAIWAILEYGDEESDWKAGGWSESDNGAYWYREWNLSDFTESLGDIYELDENRIGKYRVVVEKVDGSTVNIVSQGIVDGGRNVAGGYNASRYIETEFKRPNPFDYGLIAKELLSFNGQPSFSSFHSGEDAFTNLNWKTVASSPLRENATVGSVSSSSSDVSPGNAKIYGDLATGSADDGSDSVTGGASISGDVIYDFEMDLPEVTLPDTSGSSWINTL